MSMGEWMWYIPLQRVNLIQRFLRRLFRPRVQLVDKSIDKLDDVLRQSLNLAFTCPYSLDT